MTLQRRIHPEAAAELADAARWYEAKQRNLGREFLAEVEAAVQHILDWPQTAAVFPGWDGDPVIRSKRVRTFPYRVIYYLAESEIVLIAYAHTRRMPGYWRQRLDD